MGNNNGNTKKKISFASCFGMVLGFFAMVMWVAWGNMLLSALSVAKDDLSGLFASSSVWAFGMLCSLLFARAPIRFLNVSFGLVLPCFMEQLVSSLAIWQAMEGFGILSKLFVIAIAGGFFMAIQIAKTIFMRSLGFNATT